MGKTSVLKMEVKTINNVIKALNLTGYLWAAIGMLIVVISNIIVINEIALEFLFLPINPRNNGLVVFLLLAPVVILVLIFFLKRNYKSLN